MPASKYLYMFLSFSETPTRPTGLIYSLDYRNCTCNLVGSAGGNCACQFADLLLFWNEPRGNFDVHCYVVITSQDNIPCSMLPKNISCNINMEMESSDIAFYTTSSTWFNFSSISPNINYSVCVITVSKCGSLSEPTVLQEENFVSIGEFFCMCIDFKIYGSPFFIECMKGTWTHTLVKQLFV